MRVFAGGVVTNELNEVLLILRDDSRTWAVPGGGLDVGEMPPAGAAREVEEETGIKVMPLRLVELQFRPEPPAGHLGFTFRCLRRGGRLTPSPESPRVSFLPSDPLPRPMLGLHQQSLRHSLIHRGGPPAWYSYRLPWPVRLGREMLYGYRDLRRRLRGEPVYQAPGDWQVGAFVVLRNPAGEVLWVKRTDQDMWNLPGGGQSGLEAPWETAVRETYEETGLTVRLTDLPSIEVKPAHGLMVFTFSAEVTGGQLTTGPEAADFAYFPAGGEPANVLPRHVVRTADAVAGHGVTQFRQEE